MATVLGGLAASAATACSPPLPYTELWTVMTESTGRNWNDLGNYDFCQNATLGITEYCLMYTSQHLYGVCVPSSCTPDEIRDPSTGILAWLMLMISSLVFEDPTDATIYCGTHDFPWTPGAYAVVGVLLLILGLVLLGTMLDRLDRVLKRAAVAEDLKVAADVSATNATVQAVLYAHGAPMADVDGGVSSATAATAGNYAPSPYSMRPSNTLPAPGEQYDSVAGVAFPGSGMGAGSWGLWSQPGSDTSMHNDFRRLGSSGGGGGALVAASAAARFSLGAYGSSGGGSPTVVSAAPPRGRGGGRTDVYGSPTGMELAAASAFPLLLGSDDTQVQRQRSALDSMYDFPGTTRGTFASGAAGRSGRYGGGMLSPAGTLPRTNSAFPATRFRNPLSAGDFPPASDADASADFVGHAKARRISSASSEADSDTPRPADAGRKVPYDLMSGPLLRAALKCFSLTYNWPRLVSIAPLRAGELGALNGLRSLSLCLVIFGQTVVSMVPVGFTNASSFKLPHGILTSALFQGVLSADFGVDTLLVMSGFMAALALMRHAIEDNGGRLAFSDVASFLLHRIARMLPVYAMILVFFVYLVPLIGTGPFWWQIAASTGKCQNLMWSNLVFANNMYPWSSNWSTSCAPWTFLVAVDMQLSLLTPLAVVLFLLQPKVGIGAVVILWLASVAIGAQAIVSLGTSAILNPALQVDHSYLDSYYTKPWTRAPPYFVGVLLAFAMEHVRLARVRQLGTAAVPVNSIGVETYVTMHAKKDVLVPYTWTPAVQYLLLLPALGVMLTCFYVGAGAYTSVPSPWPYAARAAYSIVSRPAWSAAVAVVIFVCLTNRQNFVNRMLSQPLFEPMARLTFAAYVVHPIVMQVCYYAVIDRFRYSGIMVTCWFASNLVFSYLVSALCFLLVEKPAMNLEVLFSSRIRACFRRNEWRQPASSTEATAGSATVPLPVPVTPELALAVPVPSTSVKSLVPGSLSVVASITASGSGSAAALANGNSRGSAGPGVALARTETSFAEQSKGAGSFAQPLLPATGSIQ